MSTNLPTIPMNHADQAKEQRLAEYRKGGNQAPCPFCNVPRFQRSDYIRCCVCGINWLKGENLDKHPSLERKAAFLKSAAKGG
jgi:hypothetical protein